MNEMKPDRKACPVCGSSQPLGLGDDYLCLNCGTRYPSNAEERDMEALSF